MNPHCYPGGTKNCSNGAVECRERERLDYSEITLPFSATIYLSLVFTTSLKISVICKSTVCAVLKHRDANKCSVRSFFSALVLKPQSEARLSLQNVFKVFPVQLDSGVIL